MPRGNPAAVLALCTAVLFWGLSFTATKLALTGLTPFTILFLRFALAAFLFCPAFFRSGIRGLGFAGHLKILAISVIFPGCYFTLETFALRLTTATNASLISATIPLAVLALTAAVSSKRPASHSVIGVLASLAGVVLLTGLGQGTLKAGDALMLGAVVSASAYMVATSRLCRDMSPVDLTAMQMFWGTVFFLPFFLSDLPEAWAGATAPPLEPLAAVAGLGLFATVAAFLAYNFALSRVPATTAAMFINAVPVVAVAGAHIALGEGLGLAQAAGGALILGAACATARIRAA